MLILHMFVCFRFYKYPICVCAYVNFAKFENLGFKLKSYRQFSRSYCSVQAAMAVDVESSDDVEEDGVKPTVGDLIWRNTNDDVSSFMKMERRIEPCSSRWFPYLDRFKAGSRFLSSREVLDAVEPSLMELRKERFRNVVNNRTYSVCLVVEGLSDAGNVSAVFRSADALGFQSVHVVSLDSSKRCLIQSEVT